MYVPIAVGRDDIVNAELLTDFLDTKMKSIGFQLLARHVGHDGGRQTHEACSLVLGCITPSVALLSLSRAIGFASGFWVATSFGFALLDSFRLFAAEAALPQRDVVRAGDALISPRHRDGSLKIRLYEC